MVAVSRRPYHRGNGGVGGTGSSSFSSSFNRSKPIQLLATIVLCVISYYTGSLSSNNIAMSQHCEEIKQQAISELLQSQSQQHQGVGEKEEERIESIVQKRVHQVLMEHDAHEMENDHQQSQLSLSQHQNKDASSSSSSSSTSATTSATTSTNNNHKSPLFQYSHSSLVNGIARVSKDEFVQRFDFGSPQEKGEGTNAQDVLVLYNTMKSIPTSNEQNTNDVQYGKDDGTSTSTSKGNNNSDNSIFPFMSTQEATENCDTMNVVTVGNPGHTNQCTVLINNYENYHVQRWMRVPSESQSSSSKTVSRKLDHANDLQLVGRGYTSNGARTFTPADDRSIAKHWKSLYTYLDTVDDVLKRLSPIAAKVGGANKDNTIIVMTCNMGQSELLMNFVCNAKAKGFDLDSVLVFPTDVETKDLAEGLGLATFYDEKVSWNNNIHLEREREKHAYICICMYACMYLYIYIYLKS